MNIEDIIKNKKKNFDTNSLPAGHQQRFAQKLQAQINHKTRIRELRIILSLSIAVMLLVILIIPNIVDFTKKKGQTQNDKVVEMRQIYNQRVDDAIIRLEKVLEKVDDSTRTEIVKVIEDLTNTSDVFTEIAPLPEEKQMAITSQIYDNQLEILNIIYKNINKEK